MKFSVGDRVRTFLYTYAPTGVRTKVPVEGVIVGCLPQHAYINPLTAATEYEDSYRVVLDNHNQGRPVRYREKNLHPVNVGGLPVVAHGTLTLEPGDVLKMSGSPKPVLHDSCPKCGHRGRFVQMALVCPFHGVWAGC